MFRFLKWRPQLSRTITCAVPKHQPGDTLVSVVLIGNADSFIGPPGWTRTPKGKGWMHVATVAEPASYTFEIAGDAEIGIAAVDFETKD